MIRLILRFQLKSFLLLVLAAGLIVAVGLAKKQLTAAFFVRSLDWSGFICILIGCFSMMGSFVSRGSFEVQHSRSAGSESLDRRAARDVKDMLASYYYLVLFAWTGGLQLLLSMLIQHTAL